MDKFFQIIFNVYNYLKPLLDINYPISMTPEQEAAYQNATVCHLCDKAITENKVRDHDHRIKYANFRGAAHQSCNINCKKTKKIPVVFHNLKNYDSHLIMQELGKHISNRKVNCIAQDTEKYISFSIDDLCFIDSYNFLSAPLHNLVAGLDEFKFMSDHPLLQRKGVYPYEYMTDRSKFMDQSLPPIEKFYSKVTMEGISEQDYAHAQQVWKVYNIKNMKEYHDLYLKTDVLLLADVFETFRDLCLKDYKLDPAHMVSLPGFTWHAALKKTDVELELLRDINKHLFIEAGIRGGISMISTRYSRANNKYMASYDPNQESKYIMYLDCNSLYSTAMCRPLPISEFVWVSEQQYKSNNDDNYGFILEVDLEYGSHLHSLHNDYPLAPERVNGKLVPNLNNKTKYVLHYKALKKYEELGLKVTRYHKILQFKQKAWLKPYIEFNIEKRKNAKSKFEMDFYKLLNNSFYGRTLMNKRKHRDVRLVNELQLKKLVAKSTFDYSKEFDDNFYAVHMHKLTVKLDTPIYLGMTILDLSKVIMYDFYYGYMSKFKKKLILTDTDSFIMEVITDDFYAEMDLEYFDTSNYPINHPCYSSKNKKVNGRFKDECGGSILYECVGLRPKLYSYITETLKEEKRAKGVARATREHLLKHEHYLECLITKADRVEEVTLIQSKLHHISTVTTKKKVLSCDDDKRYICENNIDTLAWGHYKLK